MKGHLRLWTWTWRLTHSTDRTGSLLSRPVVWFLLLLYPPPCQAIPLNFSPPLSTISTVLSPFISLYFMLSCLLPFYAFLSHPQIFHSFLSLSRFNTTQNITTQHITTQQAPPSLPLPSSCPLLPPCQTLCISPTILPFINSSPPLHIPLLFFKHRQVLH